MDRENESNQGYAPKFIPAPTPVPRSAAGAFLGLAGLALVAVGALLPYADRIPEPARRMAQELSQADVGAGSLISAGLVLMGIAAAMGYQRRLALALAAPKDHGLRDIIECQFENLTNNLAASSQSLARIGNDLTALTATFRAYTAASAADTGPRDAIFQLAGSVDKLGATVGRSFEQTFEPTFEHLRQEVLGNVIHIEERMEEFWETHVVQAAPVEPEHEAEHEYEEADETVHHEEHEYEEAQDELEPDMEETVYVELEEPEEATPASLGLLDELEDEAVEEPASDECERIELGDVEEPRAPLPSSNGTEDTTPPLEIDISQAFDRLELD